MRLTGGCNDVEELKGVVYSLIMCVSNMSVLSAFPECGLLCLCCRMASSQALEDSVSVSEINMLILW